MRFPLFQPRSGEDPVRIPLPEGVEIGFGIYFRPDGSQPPDPEELQSIFMTWLDGHAEDPLRSQLRAVIEREGLRAHVGAKEFLPLPPMELLREGGMRPDEERRLQEATHLAVVSVAESMDGSHLGLWCALGAARAAAAAFGGVVLDPEIPRLLPVAACAEPLPADGRVRVMDHIVVPCSFNARGLGWMTTRGMGKFGLPELEIRELSPDIATSLARVMNALAQLLVATATESPVRRGVTPQSVEIGPEIRLSLEHLARARGEDAGSEPPEGIRGWTPLRLEYRGRRPGGPFTFVRLVPPLGFDGEPGVWLHDLVGDLFGSDGPVVAIPSDSESVETAHRRASAELPTIKRRFQIGLHPGETLYVKHGFPTTTSGHEYMWVVVNAWTLDRIRGQLANDPQIRLDLHAGQRVELREAEIFDWLLANRDGSTEGGYTTRVVEREGQGAS